ncbi:hypothetical protein ACFVYR_28070 [Streptomyces sp. NPDC058284]|uniref:hypothetical protein n=1 Tax=unclassified Streptomyces TaxID=2593676 RepID=UPI00364AF56D
MSPDDDRKDGLFLGGSGETRTRLPEGDGGSDDVYGGPRRSSRSGGRTSSRSLVTVVGVVVLLIAAIAFANRGGDDSSSGGGDGKKPEAASTAPSGEKPVGGKNAGIPSGFARTQQGAQSAASNYAVALGGTGMFKADSRHGIVDAIYTSDAATKLRKPMDDAYSTKFLERLGLDPKGDPPQGSTFVSRTVPVGTKVLKYSNDDAKVSVWYMGLLGMSGQRSTNPVSSTWQTWTFDLRWSGNDWKITADSQESGPTPVPGDERASSSDDISKAIEEYGGFTYAR